MTSATAPSGAPGRYGVELPPRKRLRTRVLAAMIATTVGTVVVAGLFTLVLTRRAAVNTAQGDLDRKAPQIASQLERLGTLLRARAARSQAGVADGDLGVAGLRSLLSATLRINGGGLVTVLPDDSVGEGLVGLGGRLRRRASGAATTPSAAPPAVLELPAGVSVDELDPAALAAGRTVRGRAGTTVFIAVPLRATVNGTPALVLTEKIPANPAKKAGGFFLIAAAAAIALATAAAYLLARRLTRPLTAMDATAQRLAGGDLSARVDLGEHPHDELGGLAQSLNDMAGQLEQARGLERAFVLSVSHDLRTPLTSIRGYAEAMLDGTLAPGEGTERAARVITAEARRLERLVADLLDLARLDARQFSLHPVSVNAASVVRTAVDGFRPQAEDLGITLGFTGPDDVPATADAERLGQIVANLVENALKFAVATVRVDTVPYSSGEIDLRVSDDGPGIAAADLPHVFERLFTSRTVPGRTVGTGLGLAIVRDLAEAMGGIAWVEPGLAGGASFVVRLPLQPAPAPAPSAAGSPPR